MKPPKILITRRFPGPGIEALEKKFDVTLPKGDSVLSPWRLRRAIRGMEAIICLLTDKIEAPIMDAAGPQLKLIANYAVGFDNIDIKAAHERKIVVTNTPGVLTEAVAEHTFALLMAVARRVAEADRFTRRNRYHGWQPDLFVGMELQGKTLGLIGLGRIGSRVAEIAQAFGMKTIYFDEIRNKEEEKKVEFHELETVLKTADIISLHVPLLPSTKHLIGGTELKLMKPTAILINTARGPVVDEAALVEALHRRQIMGAGLDVFEHEPHISRALERLENVVITSHIASATTEARLAMSQIVANNVVAFFATGKALNPAV